MTERTNEEWVAALGQEGSLEQQQALEDLGRYLYRVVYNYLLKRQGDIFFLSNLASSDLAELCRDFVQQALITIWQKLNVYDRRGRFLAFAATIAIREAGQELRKKNWTTVVRLPARSSSGKDDEIEDDDWLSRLAQKVEPGLCAEQRVQLQDVMDIVLRTVDEDFSETQRIAFRGRFGGMKTNRELAKAVGVTQNRVYGLIYEGRAILKSRLEAANYTLEDIYAILNKGDRP
jgi:RNA polymerase sigma factor (sigma-70 family)